MTLRMVKCPTCGSKYLASQGCAHCSGQPQHSKRDNASNSNKGPIVAFFVVLAGLLIASEIVLANMGFTPSLLVVFGGVVVMWLWKIGYWLEDGESIIGHLAFQAVANEVLGFFLSPSKIIWFWKTERPYFRACTIATWLAAFIFGLIHIGQMTGKA